MRYKCIVSYDGTNFHGFQIQKKERTIELVIEEVLSKITNKNIKIYGAGRTDAGVHALNQVFHFDYDVSINPSNFKRALNSRLPSDIHINKVEVVNEDFHSRFSAKNKTYKYLVDTNEENPLLTNYRWYYKYKINYDSIKDAVNIFIGEHDFASFTKGHDKDNTVRVINYINVENDNGLITFTFNGNGFLHNQVRIMVAMILEVARGKISINDLKEILNAKSRDLSPKTAPAVGLYLIDIEY